jgi:hypothetical protein
METSASFEARYAPSSYPTSCTGFTHQENTDLGADDDAE